MEETNRQRKIAGVLQKDLVDVLQKAAQDRRASCRERV